jgi:hypothetical protein
MAITSLGIYGFLASSYQDTAYRLQNLETIVANQETKRDRFQTQLDAVTREKQAVDKNVIQLTSALSNNQNRYVDAKGNQIVKTDAGNRKAYEKQLDISTQRLQELTKRETALSDSVTAIDLKITDLQTTSTVASEVGPLKYIAKITGKSMDTVVNWLIVMLILVFDPLAIILLISANKALQNKQPVVEAINDQITDSVTVAEPETKHQPVYKHQPEIPQILSYRNKFKNEREKKYKK